MLQRARLPWWDALLAGAALGALAEALVLRLNPEVTLAGGGLLAGFVLWTSWGALGAGGPLLLVLAIWRRLRRGRDPDLWWPLPRLLAAMYLFAAVMSRVNADLHPQLLSASAHRILRQDAVAWLVVALLTLLIGRLVELAPGRRAARAAFAGALLVLPVVRLATNPTPPMQPTEGEIRAVGRPERPLLVLGIEGLDSRTVLGSGGDEQAATLQALMATGSWGSVRPNRPYLRWSLWTTLATGAEPGRHGVKSDRAWELSVVFAGPLRLMPWTPQGSRLILPWYLARQVRPPVATLPPLWEWLRSSGVTTLAIDWPGVWGQDVELYDPRVAVDGVADLIPPATTAAVEQALASFPRQASTVRRALDRDARRVESGRAALERGAGSVWIHLESVVVVRRLLEPMSPLDVAEREAVGQVVGLIDGWVGSLVEAAGSDALVAVASPYGLAPPDGWERLRRLLGGGGDWRVAPDQCPDGLLLLAGGPVRAGHLVAGARVPDLAPTLCYLLGLPVAQYMEGRVLVDAIRPEWVAEHPMQVVD